MDLQKEEKIGEPEEQLLETSSQVQPEQPKLSEK